MDTEPQLIISITYEYQSVSWEFHCLYVWVVDRSVINFFFSLSLIKNYQYFVIKITPRVLSKVSADSLHLHS